MPVGKDQKQHLEFARDIAERFNTQFGQVLTIPEPDIDENTATVPGVDGAKMSKSYKNTIDFFGTEKEIKKKVMSIVSDSKAVEEPKDPETSVIFQIHSLFLSPSEKESQIQKYKRGGSGYGDLKKDLLDSILAHFAPYRAKREELAQNLDYVHQVLKEGKEKAQTVAERKLTDVRKTLGIYPF